MKGGGDSGKVLSSVEWANNSHLPHRVITELSEPFHMKYLEMVARRK